MAQARLGVRKAIRDVTKTGRSQRASRSVRAKRKRYLGDGMIEQRSCSQLAVDKSSEVHCKALEELRRRSSQSVIGGSLIASSLYSSLHIKQTI